MAPGEGAVVVQDWFVYLIRAASGALYCGCTTDPARRFAQHASGRGARFFRSSPAQALVYVERCDGRGAALSREAAIKKLGKVAKERLVRQWLLEQEAAESLAD